MPSPPLLLFFFLLLLPRHLLSLPSPCDPPHHPFCNTSLPLLTRAHSLLSLLILPEKALLLSSSAAAIPRLSIPAFSWWSESLHGLAANGPGIRFQPPFPSATVFPQVILSTAAFNRTLWARTAEAIAVEARAMHNGGLAGLTFWAPNVNVFRDPRWGRGQETPGEDPMVVGEYGVAYVLGLQGEEKVPKGRLMVSACCKHYAAYDLEKWGSFTRYTFNAKVTKQDMEDTYEPPFRSCIQDGRASCLMCSYNEVNGVPVCADRDLLEKARCDWGFRGYITSDCNAVATIFEYQNYTKSPVDAVALALKAGVDLNCGGYYTLYAKEALESGKIQEEDIDQALLNLFFVQLRLGFFDGDPLNQQFGSLGPANMCTAEHLQLALESARQGIVLLKNKNSSLPLVNVNSLAVIGPIADNSTTLGGDYAGVPCTDISILDALRSRTATVFFSSGCSDGVPCTSDTGFKDALDISQEAEVVVVVVGLDLMRENEDLDRVSLLLPGKQADLVSAVAKVSRSPIVLILVGGGPIDVSFAEQDPRIGSILWAGYPGEAGPQAVAEVIFGDMNPEYLLHFASLGQLKTTSLFYNGRVAYTATLDPFILPRREPLLRYWGNVDVDVKENISISNFLFTRGRLPITWYPESFMSVPMDDMHMRPDPSRGYPGRTYRFYTGPVLYRFGHGLSYSDYEQKFISAPDKISLSTASRILQKSAETLSDNGLDRVLVSELAGSCNMLKFTVQVSVKNVGNMDGGHAVLLFSHSTTRKIGAPLKQLVGFERVEVVAGRTAEATIAVEPCKHMSFADEKGQLVLPLGAHVLMLESGVEHVTTIEP